MSYWSNDYYGWAPRKTVAQRRAEAARAIKDASRRGQAMSPISIAGRKIAQTFWGEAWCDNLERYRDFAYRLERGRSYVRSGSVIDLKIAAGKVVARVSGSSLYDVEIEIDEVKREAWRAIQKDCAGGIGSRIDLLDGQLTEPVMARLCAERTGLFPHPSAIRFTCSCPDYAAMCKHVAAVMYGIGARLDHAPELLFTLRRVSLDELVASAVTELPATPSAGRVLAANGLASLFGIELAEAAAPVAARSATRGQATRTAARAAGGASRRASGAAFVAVVQSPGAVAAPVTRSARAVAAATVSPRAAMPAAGLADARVSERPSQRARAPLPVTGQPRRAAKSAAPATAAARRAAEAATSVAGSARQAAKASVPVTGSAWRAAKAATSVAGSAWQAAKAPAPVTGSARRAATAAATSVAGSARRAAKAPAPVTESARRAAEAAAPVARRSTKPTQQTTKPARRSAKPAGSRSIHK